MDHITATTALQASRPTIGDAVTSVVEAIRDQILAGMLPAGGQLKQNRLAQSLGVSHIPVREALKVLESEGFVIWHPRRGAFVADLTIDSASEIWELRGTNSKRQVMAGAQILLFKAPALARTRCWFCAIT